MITLAFLFLLHFIGDFLCQSRWMAENKSKNLVALTAHVLSYSAVFFIGLNYIERFDEVIVMSFVSVNAILHWITDLGSSQLTSYFRAKENNYGFFSTIGADQLVHQITIMYLAYMFLGIK